ncbi:MAG TPA: hypothetical protein DIT48_01440 [Actinobacteria bacterium]|jgi:hypothetical protein|nr:hypothetical protein [Actinomycetota bacterium]
MKDDTLQLRGTPVQALPRKNRQWAEGRQCIEEGCSTTISIYNKAKYCWAHEPVRYYIPRGRKKRLSEVEAA